MLPILISLPSRYSMEEMAKVTALIDSQQKRHKRHPIHKGKGSDRLDGDQQLLALKDLYGREGDSGQCYRLSVGEGPRYRRAHEPDVWALSGFCSMESDARFQMVGLSMSSEAPCRRLS